MDEAERLADSIVVIDRGRVIASGTAGELKAQVGGDRLELQAAAGTDPRPLAQALAGLGTGRPVVDIRTGRVVLPVTDGPEVLAELARRLATSGLRVADLALRRPSLEDVFLALTGQPGAGPSHAGPSGTQPAAETGSPEPALSRTA
jgi:ABC-2 type transport system ATP-binding protein